MVVRKGDKDIGAIGLMDTPREAAKVALKRLKVYIGVPEELRSAQLQTIEDADVKTLRGNYMQLIDLSKILGWSLP